jgi:hypothetical protein
MGALGDSADAGRPNRCGFRLTATESAGKRVLFSFNVAPAKVDARLKNIISKALFPFRNNLLVVVSSDSQSGHKNGGDSPAPLGIIKG